MTTRRNVEPYNAEVGTTPEPPGFDVVCIVGRVVFGGGTDTPLVAAMRIIAECGVQGVYTFPQEVDGMMKVTLEYIDGTEPLEERVYTTRPPRGEYHFGETRPHDETDRPA